MPSVVQISLVIFVYMVLVFLVALLKKDNSIVDVFWGPGFILVAIFSWQSTREISLVKVILNLAVLVWGTRLGVYIFLRKRGKEEDFRYKAWRDQWKHFILRSFFQVFILQGVLMLIIAMPVYYVNLSRSHSFGMAGIIGTGLVICGLLFEIAGDYQLSVFKKDPVNKGRIITSGLWKYTRHPNYFGEALFWWGISCFALSLPGGWKTMASPLLITFFLRFVSGVPMLEKKYKGRTDWEEYCKKTPPFVPFVKFL
jgi:steroid 5-alpha reductase family enzyme